MWDLIVMVPDNLLSFYFVPRAKNAFFHLHVCILRLSDCYG